MRETEVAVEGCHKELMNGRPNYDEMVEGGVISLTKISASLTTAECDTKKMRFAQPNQVHAKIHPCM